MKMKKGKNDFERTVFVVFCVFCCWALLAGYSCKADASPVSFINNKAYDFGTILEGKKIPHDFIIENRGDKPLKIFRVRTTCGCTTVSYSKEILPGQDGKVSVMFDSLGYGGMKVDKKIRVDTNDPKLKHFDLSITGRVDALVHIAPKSVILKGDAGKNIETELTITPNPRSPFKIISAKPSIGKYVSCSLKEVKDSKSIKYVLTVKNLRQEKGKYRDYIYLKTDSKIRPGISIRVRGEIR